jgi:quercetin dioxygenase-like cupin family protein
MAKMEARSFGSPDEVIQFEKGKLELVKIGGAVVRRAVFQPGWKWSKHVKPIAKTKSCEAAHFQYQVSGTLHVVMDDGTEREMKAGDVYLIPPGHDGWVVGNEPVVAVDFQGIADYAKESAKKK